MVHCSFFSNFERVPTLSTWSEEMVALVQDVEYIIRSKMSLTRSWCSSWTTKSRSWNTKVIKMNFLANPFLPGLCRYACLLGLYCESGKWILYFFDEYGWFSTLSLLKRPFHSKAQGLQVGGRVSQLLRLAGGHLPNKDCPALPAAPQCPALRLPPATPSAPPSRSGHRHREPHCAQHRAPLSDNR